MNEVSVLFRAQAVFLGVAAATALLAAGCKPVYRYGLTSYPTADAGVAAARADSAAVVAAVRESNMKVEGTAEVIVPSVARTRERGVVKTGTPRPEEVDYVARTLVVGWEGMGNALARAGVFSSVTVREDDDPEVAESSADWTIWLNLVDPNVVGWYIRQRGGTQREPLPVDIGQQPKDRPGAWAYSVARVASRMKASGGVK